jgi:hypothetical protein
MVKMGTVVVPLTTMLLRSELWRLPYANNIWSDAGENCIERTTKNNENQ